MKGTKQQSVMNFEAHSTVDTKHDSSKLLSTFNGRSDDEH